MTRRDKVWRGAGAVATAVSCLAARLEIGGEAATLCYVLVAIAGIVVMVNGHHVLTVIRAERRGHALTARAIHAGRIRHRVAGSETDR